MEKSETSSAKRRPSLLKSAVRSSIWKKILRDLVWSLGEHRPEQAASKIWYHSEELSGIVQRGSYAVSREVAPEYQSVQV
jgi:hypothetical protein